MRGYCPVCAGGVTLFQTTKAVFMLQLSSLCPSLYLHGSREENFTYCLISLICFSPEAKVVMSGFFLSYLCTCLSNWPEEMENPVDI